MLKPETVRWLQQALRQSGFSRAGLARELCERDGWCTPRGKLCAASAHGPAAVGGAVMLQSFCKRVLR